MREPSLFRTLALPLGVAVILLFVVPKTCGGLMQKGLKRASTMKKNAPASTESGLTIESSTPDPNERHQFTLPAGLSEERVQYLVEIAPQFAEPRRMRVPKVVLSDDLYPLVPVVKRLGYFEQQPDGTLGPTREAALHLPDTAEDSNGWAIPVAQRKFMTVTNAVDEGGGSYKITFKWKWEPNDLGRELNPVIAPHDGRVTITGTPGNWAVTAFEKLDADWN